MYKMRIKVLFCGQDLVEGAVVSEGTIYILWLKFIYYSTEGREDLAMSTCPSVRS